MSIDNWGNNKVFTLVHGHVDATFGGCFVEAWEARLRWLSFVKYPLCAENMAIKLFWDFDALARSYETSKDRSFHQSTIFFSKRKAVIKSSLSGSIMEAMKIIIQDRGC